MALLSVYLFSNKIYNVIGPFTLRKLSLKSSPEMNKATLYASREAKMFNKILGNQCKKKKRKLYFEDAPSDKKFNFDGHYNSSKENSRRITVMNTLFMKNISDLLMTGNINVDVLEKGLQISGVRMSKDFSHLNVFWATNNEENAAALEAVLPQLGFTLRHELSQLRVIGVVPRIIFVKDKHHHNVLKVEHLLSIADYGEDHVPLPLYSDFNNDPADDFLSNGRNESSNDKSEGEKTCEEGEKSCEEGEKTCEEGGKTCEEGAKTSEEAMPPMRQDIFNLDHERIMNKIMRYVQKSRAMHRFQPNLAIDCDGTINNVQLTSNDNLTKQERKVALSKFILDRKMLTDKQKRRDRFDSYILETTQNDDNEDFDTEDDVEEEYLEEDQHIDTRLVK